MAWSFVLGRGVGERWRVKDEALELRRGSRRFRKGGGWLEGVMGLWLGLLIGRWVGGGEGFWEGIGWV